MADLTITAASVLAGANATKKEALAGETLVAGKTAYQAAASKKIFMADSNSATAEVRRPIGIILNGASLNQPVSVQTSGDITLGAVLTAGVAYYQSDTPGGICPVADVGSGEYVCLLGLAKSTTVLALDIQFPNVAL